MPLRKRKLAQLGTPRTAAKKARRIRTNIKKSRVTRRSNYRHAANVHVYTRYATTPSDIDITTADGAVAEKFSFGYIKGFAEFQSLYDRYRITMVQLQITLLNNPDSYWGPNPNGYTLTTDGVQNRTNWYPKLWYVRDYDDENTIDLSAMRERANVKCVVLQPNKIYKINVRPAILNQTYRTTTTTGYAPKWKEWIDMAQTDVPHYGIKYNIDAQGLNPNDTNPFKIRVEYKYFFTCKDVL